MGKRRKWQSEINDAIDVGDVIAIAFESDKSIWPTLPCMIIESNRTIPFPLVVISKMELNCTLHFFLALALHPIFVSTWYANNLLYHFLLLKIRVESISEMTRGVQESLATFSLLCNSRWPLQGTTITSPHRPRWLSLVYHYIFKWEYVIGTMIPIDPRYLICRTKGLVVIPFYVSCAIPVYCVEKSRVNFARFTIFRGIW